MLGSHPIVQKFILVQFSPFNDEAASAARQPALYDSNWINAKDAFEFTIGGVEMGWRVIP